jgi:hypothetical protein
MPGAPRLQATLRAAEKETASDMSNRLRPLLLLVVALLAALVVVACGGSDDDKATSSSDVNQLLKDTFSKGSPQSGKLHLALRVDGSGAGAATGPITASLDGPFASEGSGKLPKFAIDAAFAAAGRNIKAGATSTSDKGFLSLQGQDYAVSDDVFKQFKASYEQAMKQASSNGSKKSSLATLGIDPSKWLTNPKNAGDAKVGDTDTIKITGDVNIDRMLDDVSKATAQARSLGVQGFQNLPSQLTPEQRQQIAKEIKNLKVEIYTGKDDSMLRRMHLTLGLANGSSGNANVDFDLSYTDLNEDQSIEAPSNPKPFDQLVSQLQALGSQLGGAASGGSSSSGSGSSSSSPSAKDFQKYTDCVSQAGNDTAKAQKCADILK